MTAHLIPAACFGLSDVLLHYPRTLLLTTRSLFRNPLRPHPSLCCCLSPAELRRGEDGGAAVIRGGGVCGGGRGGAHHREGTRTTTTRSHPPCSNHHTLIPPTTTAVNTAQGIEGHLKDTTYDDRQVATWINYICEDIVQALTDLGKPFKYVGALFAVLGQVRYTPRRPTHCTPHRHPAPAVHCVVMQNTGAGLHAATSEFCDGVNDGAYASVACLNLATLRGAAHPDTPLPHPHTFPAGVCVVKWPSEKNKDSGNCACIVTVFGCAYYIA